MNRTLYKLDSKNGIREWSISIDYDEETLIIEHGLMNGQKQTVVECVEENLSGRTIDEQLELEYESRIKKKRDTGYCDSIVQAQNQKGFFDNGAPRPTLAQKVNYKKIEHPIYVQPKYDGHRCLIGMLDGRIVAVSRRGLEITTIDHIKDQISPHVGEDFWFDGELYIHGESLQSLTSLIKKKQPESENLIYIVYDIVESVCYSERLQLLQSFAFDCCPHITLAETFKAYHDSYIKELFVEHKKRGYEGSIIRHGDAGYEKGKRSFSLMKVKGNLDDEFKVIDIEATKLNWASLVCQLDNGKTFNVTAHGSIENKKQILKDKDKHIGQFVRVEFANYTKDGIPFHPVAIGWFKDVEL